VRGPYGFELVENCECCRSKKSAFCRDLTPKAMKEFDAMKSNSTYPANSTLFIEKQDPRGVFFLCEGEVKLTISSSEGKTLIVRIAKAGEILGLMAVLEGRPYEVTAETLHPCQIAFVRRDDFVRFVSQHSEMFQALIKQLTSSYFGACEQLRTVALSSTAQGRLAKLLLDWTSGAEQTHSGARIQLPLTHEEIAEFIGSSRETVTRTFSEFKTQQLVTLKGSTLTISDREALEKIVAR